MSPRSFAAVCLLFLLCTPSLALAVLPPDIIFSVGSQIAQFFAVAGAMLAGLFIGFLPFMRNLFSTFTKRKVLAGLLSMFIIGVIFGGSVWLYYHAGAAGAPVAVSGATSTAATSTPHGRRFFSNYYVVSGKDNRGQDFALELDYNRKETETGFVHYYFADMRYRERVYTDEQKWTMESGAASPKAGISLFEHHTFRDFSAREDIHFRITIGGIDVDAVLSGMNGDFLVKNTPEYTKYYSAGSANITIQNETFVTDALSGTIYSSDYVPYIFFDGSNLLDATAFQAILWDDAHNFTLVDRTDTLTNVPAYPAHQWVLYKDAGAQTAQKYFRATVTESAPALGHRSWQLSVPDLPHPTLLLTEVDPFAGLMQGSFITGTASKEGSGHIMLHGILHSKHYLPQ